MTRGLVLALGTVCLCVLLGCSSVQAAPDPAATPYGESFYRVDDPRSSWRPFRPVLPDTSESAANLERRIDRQEARSGPFSPDLLEPLRSLGAAHFSAGDYRGASAAWGRALHLVRINEGLQSPAQRWLLEHLSEASIEEGLLAQADTQQRHLYSLARAQWPATDATMQVIATRYGDWLRSAYLAGVDRERYRRLVMLIAMFDSLLDEAEREEGANSRSLLPYLHGRLNSFYLITAYPGESSQPRAGDADQGEGKLDLIRFLELKRDAFREGERTAERIQAILAADPQARNSERAEALLTKADWYQWHRRVAQSLPLYSQAWQLAGERDDTWHLETFGAPLELPPGIVFQPGRLPLTEQPDTELRLRFGVGRQGRAEDIVCLCEGGEKGENLRARALALADGLRFRPRLDAGKPVDTSAIERRYHLRY